jgi:hypothetical protein
MFAQQQSAPVAGIVTGLGAWQYVALRVGLVSAQGLD